MAEFTTHKLSPHIGLEITGLDAEADIDDATRQRLTQAWIEGGILLFRGVHSNDAHQRISQCFGTLEVSAVKEINNAENPYLMELRYSPDDPKSAELPLYEVDGVTRASWLGWHWDQAFMPTIVRGAVLRMIEPAAVDGETGFIDAVGAYARLPQRLKDRIDGLEVVYQFCGDQEQNLYGYPKTLKLARGPMWAISGSAGARCIRRSSIRWSSPSAKQAARC
jgi:taurine dioxygenase